MVALTRPLLLLLSLSHQKWRAKTTPILKQLKLHVPRGSNVIANTLRLHPPNHPNWIFISIFAKLRSFEEKIFEANVQSAILKSISDGVRAIESLTTADGLKFIESVAWAIIDCYKNGGKLIIAGNGGSLCDGMHFAEELTGFFRKKRPALPAIAIADPGHLTCVGNDVGFDEIFARGVEAHGKPGDLFIVLTTSGNSKNLVRAVDEAKKKRLQVITFLGKDGGALKGQGDHEWVVSGFETSDRIQEAHMAAVHIIIEMVERELFYPAEGGEVESVGATTV